MVIELFSAIRMLLIVKDVFKIKIKINLTSFGFNQLALSAVL
jgi:hypothetical protein